MVILNYIIEPLLGSAIGYLTNDIAIRMLFCPHKPKYLFGYRLPFTPGIIPKERERIADAIGLVISDNLMNKDVLSHYLLSEEMIGKIRNSVEKFISNQKSNEEIVEHFLLHYLSDEDVKAIVESVKDNITKQAHEKITDPSIGQQVAHAAMDYVAERLNQNGAQELLVGLGCAILGGVRGTIAALFGSDVVGVFLSMLREPTENYLAKNINNMLQLHGDTLVSNLINEQSDKFLSTPVKELLKDKEEQLSQASDAVISLYMTIITEHLPKILESIDIGRIVRERINEMDIEETERLILQVMNK